DINDLNESGFSITFDKRINSYIFTDSDFTLRDLDLNNDELTALLIGKQIAHRMGKPFENAYRSILKKAQRDTGIKTRHRLKQIEGKQHFFIDIDPMEGFEGIEKQYNAITESLNKKEEYDAMHSQKKSRRIIAPYGLIFEYGLWYVIGYCHLRKEVRIFALDRIKEFRMTGKQYSIPDDFNMDDYFKTGWHMIQYGKPVEVVLKFTKHYARWIKRKKWHPTQVIEEQKDGSIIFKAAVRGSMELKWWIYHWIPHVEILSPPELRKEVIEEMREMLRMYGKKVFQKNL
ncbi:MAG: WYL domain-containing protein, partial [Nitrospinae bacterium]|nr:WYL domain-containing protein [Nitrospinota bacterium]